MNESSSALRSHLFTVRVWTEEISEGKVEWRGKVQLVTNGDARYFRQWDTLAPLLVTMLENLDAQIGDEK